MPHDFPRALSLRNYLDCERHLIGTSMPAPFPVSPRKTKSAIAFLLTFTAGMVDIVAYVCLYHIFVAHMTGITVHLGTELATAQWAASTASALFEEEKISCS